MKNQVQKKGFFFKKKKKVSFCALFLKKINTFEPVGSHLSSQHVREEIPIPTAAVCPVQEN